MKISERKVGEVVVVDLAGKLTAVDSPGMVKEKVTTLALRGQRHIVLNLNNLTYVDSSGLGELVACHLSAVRHGATVKLANTGGRMHDLLVMTKLLTIFDAHKSESEAISSFSGVAWSPVKGPAPF